MTEFDPVSLLTLHNRLVTICEEMALVMMKTAYSTIFSEGLDFCCVILTRMPRLSPRPSIRPP